MNICVIGTGYVGLVVGTNTAASDYRNIWSGSKLNTTWPTRQRSLPHAGHAHCSSLLTPPLNVPLAVVLAAAVSELGLLLCRNRV